MTETKTTWGGKRDGAGRPPKTPERCTCGRHTNARALRLRLKCRIVPGYTSKGARLLQSVTAGLPAIADPPVAPRAKRCPAPPPPAVGSHPSPSRP